MEKPAYLEMAFWANMESIEGDMINLFNDYTDFEIYTLQKESDELNYRIATWASLSAEQVVYYSVIRNKLDARIAELKAGQK